MHPTSRTLALALTAAAAGCAHEASDRVGLGPLVYVPPPSPPAITRFADQDRDGQVTRDEARADPALARVFDHYDADDSGTLDRAEFARLEGESRHARADDSGYTYMAPAPMTGRPDTAPAAPDASLNRTGIDRIHPARSE